jgi:DNA (cytosine-5)-methyltransferase 1
VRFVEIVRPEHVIIENVPGVVHDRRGVVQTARRVLRDLGYNVADGVVAADDVGWPQRRRRHFLAASRSSECRVASIGAQYAVPAPDVMWAIGDLRGSDSDPLFDSAARHSDDNRRRIDYLFRHDVYDLPDAERPDCHRLKSHSYKSVYGRMFPDEPAPTITSGFGSTGQGRFVHPTEPRTLTPHEAARLQGFPDWFDFGRCTKRGALQQMIGNAVPSRLGYVIALELLR